MDINKQDMNLDEAISVIKEIDPNYEITSTYKAESTVLNAVRNGEIVRVVRCKECRWGHLCVFGQHLGLDGFCSKGERKEQSDE